MKAKRGKRRGGVRVLLPLVRMHYRDLDEKLSSYQARWRAQGNDISCDTCTAHGCCKQLLLVHLFEAVPMVARIKADKRDTPAFRKQLRQVADAMDAADRKSWFDGNRACVLLDDNGRCTVYAERPSACRSYFVAEGGPAVCEPPARQTVPVLGCTSDASHHALEAGMTLGERYGLAAPFYVDMLPRVLLRVLAAWERVDWPQFIERQRWPSLERFESMWDASDEVVLAHMKERHG